MSGQAGLTAVMVKNGSVDSLYYTYCDYQGYLLQWAFLMLYNLKKFIGNFFKHIRFNSSYFTGNDIFSAVNNLFGLILLGLFKEPFIKSESLKAIA